MGKLKYGEKMKIRPKFIYVDIIKKEEIILLYKKIYTGAYRVKKNVFELGLGFGSNIVKCIVSSLYVKIFFRKVKFVFK